MQTPRSVELTAKCTTCQKTFVLTHVMMEAARCDGVATSPCCLSVATVVSVKTKPLRQG